MEFKIKYPGLSETLRYLKAQAKLSIPFAADFLPAGHMTPEEVFNFLKGEVIYFNDPYRTELLQKMPTLFGENNQHNIYGAGDCDCFTIAALASLYAKGYRDLGIRLASYSINNPTHIYAVVNNQAFDLTNKKFDTERPYRYFQTIPVKF